MIDYRVVQMPHGRVAYVVDDYCGKRHAVIAELGLLCEMERALNDWAKAA